MSVRSQAGVSLVELSLVVGLLGLTIVLVLPRLGEARSVAGTAAGARWMAQQLHATRWASVSEGRARGMWFERDGEGWFWRDVADGNGNGLRRAEIRSGTDPVLSPRQRLAARVSGVTLGFPAAGALPERSPSRSRLADGQDPVRFGASDIVTFSPIGRSSSGTLYVTDGRALSAIVLYGRTGRVRVWRYRSDRRQWES